MTLRKLLVPIDYSDHSYQALQWGASLAKVYGAQLVLLHILPRRVEEVRTHVPVREWVPSSYYTGEAPASELFRVERTVIDLVEEARNRLQNLAAKALPEMAPVEVQVAIGKPAWEILRVAEEEGVDLIVMGTHGRTGLGHAVLGSVAEKMVRTAPCPVFTVRAGLKFRLVP